jgi:hypothetical protein
MEVTLAQGTGRVIMNIRAAAADDIQDQIKDTIALFLSSSCTGLYNGFKPIPETTRGAHSHPLVINHTKLGDRLRNLGK